MWKERKEISIVQADPEASLGKKLRSNQQIQWENHKTSEMNSIQLSLAQYKQLTHQ
jgi:hypothetical protein